MNTISSDLSGAACDRVRPVVAGLMLASLLLGSQATAQQQTAASERKAAVLKIQEFSFFYRSRVAALSCSDVERRVATIMMALGARDDVNVSATGCETVVLPDEPLDARMTRSDSDPWQIGGPGRWGTSSDRWQTPSDAMRGRNPRREQSTHVRIRAMLPIEVTPEVLEEIRRDKSRRELISRVTRNPAASLNDPILFPAQRRLVTLSNRTLKLEPQECELLEQMSSGVFRKLNMRVVRSTSCDHDQIGHTTPQAVVETLMPIFEKSPPAGGSGESDPGVPAASETPSSEPASETPPQ